MKQGMNEGKKERKFQGGPELKIPFLQYSRYEIEDDRMI